ncbi:FAD-binding oxidoreductase [Geomicrobium sp. JCM 19038]|uniref:NAD(P)/FAD-dependent oxidoreductase n=1 Tax=Geomicrobium sp. JCM 19038 TaxID=1460635 RepID=UPI00045F102E|nr:FAD-dependent oxidoreductase [Geomicrobium sp. JCM 19038]GAK07927.1 sarcosine oxidase beta subunit [Geomicrobium sp. JCM 19038]
MKSAEVVVIGAGVIGTSIAYRLAQTGREVLMIDRNGIGAATSSACDKAIFLQSKRPGLHMELARESRKMYDTLENELGQSVEFKGAGGTVAIQTESQMEFMKQFINNQNQAGIDVSLLDQQEAKESQPILADDVIGAAYSPDDAEVNPLKLSQGFAAAAKRIGVKFQTHTEVIGIEKSNGKITGVKTAKGTILTETVVNATGPFASAIAQFTGVPMNIEPRRGVILISEKVARLFTVVYLTRSISQQNTCLVSSLNMGLDFHLDKLILAIY